jgi:hypothetical protein
MDLTTLPGSHLVICILAVWDFGVVGNMYCITGVQQKVTVLVDDIVFLVTYNHLEWSTL